MVCVYSLLHVVQFYGDNHDLFILVRVVFSFALLPMVPLGTFSYVIWWICVCISVGHVPNNGPPG